MKSEILEVIANTQDPFTNLAFGKKSIINLEIDNNIINFSINLDYPISNPKRKKILTSSFRKLLSTIQNNYPEITDIIPNFISKIHPHKVQPNTKLLPSIKNIIAVASSKGGVGKSTTAVNLAIAMALEGAKVGIFDADIYGPSIPQMLGIANSKPNIDANQKIVPLFAHTIKAISIGFMIDTDTPMIWRGPLATRTLNQLINDTLWGELDYLFIDMPPGTGDIQITISQVVPLTGAVIVTTPQDIAILDAKKGFKMFEKVGVNILGIVENMSMFVCPNCQHQENIFSQGGALKMADEYGVEVLGNLPLQSNIRKEVDSGNPTVSSNPNSKVAQLYRDIAFKIAIKLAQKSKNYDAKISEIVIESNK